MSSQHVCSEQCRNKCDLWTDDNNPFPRYFFPLPDFPYKAKCIFPPRMISIREPNNEELNGVQTNIPSSVPIEPKEDTFCHVCKETIADDKFICSEQTCIESWLDPNWHAINKPVLKKPSFAQTEEYVFRESGFIARGIGSELESGFLSFLSTKPPNPDLEQLD